MALVSLQWVNPNYYVYDANQYHISTACFKSPSEPHESLALPILPRDEHNNTQWMKLYSSLVTGKTHQFATASRVSYLATINQMHFE